MCFRRALMVVYIPSLDDFRDLFLSSEMANSPNLGALQLTIFRSSGPQTATLFDLGTEARQSQIVG